MTPPGLVDHQAHWYPRRYFASLLHAHGYPRARRTAEGFVFTPAPGEETLLAPRFFELDLQMDDLAAHGCAAAVVSPNFTGEVARMESAQAVETLELLHEEYAAAQRAHPGRFAGLAMLPLQDPDAALGVLDRAIGVHGLKGVCLLSNVAGAPIVSDALRPVYARIAELGVPVVLHPSHASAARDHVYNGAIDVGLGWMFDTAAAALALIYGGVLDDHPDLVVVHPHLGGVLPYVRRRVARNAANQPMHHDLTTYLRTRFWVDGTQPDPGALALAVDTYGADRLLFATDHPWLDRGEGVTSWRESAGPELLSQVAGNRVPGLEFE
jgi:aminocarboxymuconate-semialdehyde decarboxylase